MKKTFIITFLSLSALIMWAQDSVSNRFKSLLNSATNDSERNQYLDVLFYSTIWLNTDTGILYAEKKLRLARENKNRTWEAEALTWYGYGISYSGNYPLSIEYILQGLKIAEELNSPELKFNCYSTLTEVYRDQGDLGQALYYARRKMEYTQPNDSLNLMEGMLSLGVVYEKFNNLDSAQYFIRKAMDVDIAHNGKIQRSYIYLILGNIYRKTGQYGLALSNYHQVIVSSRREGIGKDLIDAYNGMSRTFILDHQKDSALYYARLAVDEGKRTNFQVAILETYGIISSIYESLGNKDSTIRYLGLTMQTKDKMFNQANERKIQSLAFQEELDRQSREVQRKEYQGRIRQISLLGTLIFLLFILAVLYRNNRHKQKAKLKIQTAYDGLQLAQAELQTKNRELEIEGALERIRTRTMAMDQSDELFETVYILFQQFKELGVDPEQMAIGIFHEEKGEVEVYVTRLGNKMDSTVSMPLSEPHVISKAYQAWSEKKKSLVIDLSGQALQEYNEFRNARTGLDWRNQLTEKRRVIHFAYFSMGQISVSCPEPMPEEGIQLLERFSGVLDLTFTRFFDLKKAEAQTREAKIEAALEKVRSRSLAMHNSEELGDVIYVLLEKLKALGVVSSIQSAVMMVFEPGYRVFTQWVVSDWMPKAIGFRTPFIENQILADFWEAKEQGIGFYEKPYPPDQKNALFKYFFELLHVDESDPSRKIVYDSTQYTFCTAIEKNSAIAVASFSGTLLTPAEGEILKRFARVFEQCYIRFMDLKQAEAQTREARIEAALERVRSRAMAMQSSAELGNIIETVYNEFGSLDISIDRALIMIFDPGTNITTWWLASPEGGANNRGYAVQKYDHPLDTAQWQGWNERNEKWHYLLEGEDKKAWDDYLFYESELVDLPGPVKDYMQSVRSVHLSASFANFGGLMAATIDPVSDEQFEIVQRFAKVFDLAYTRFNDLKQAEKSAREAKIELALERIRARTMAMQKSEELSDVAELLFKQVSDLGIKTWTSGFNVWSDDNSSYVDYITNPLGGFMEPYTIHTDQAEMFAEIRDARKSGSEFFVQYGDGERLKETYLALNKQADKNQFDKIREAGFDFPLHQYDHFVFGAKLSLMFITYDPVPEAHDVFKRLGKVFEQTYTRFQDLQRAEAQVYESTIEAALEKVRGKALAMHNSHDLVSTASMVFTELKKLGITPIRCGVGLLSRDSRRAQLYSATSKEDGDHLGLLGWVELSGHPVLTNIYDTWLRGEDFYPELTGLELKTYYEQLLSGLSVPSLPDWQSGKTQFGHFFPSPIGCLYAWSEVHYSDGEIKILKRFAAIIDLTFRRYLELQKSEASAKEAGRRASLDRVRAEIASMRTTGDLQRITPLIWNELKTLGVPFVRCGVFIMDEEKRQSHTFLSSPDGEAIAAFHLPFDSTANFADVVEHWRQKRNYLSHWGKTEFSGLGDILLQQRSIATKDQYMNSIPGDGIWLHLLPFRQGMLYVGNHEALNEDDMLLVQSLADAFSTAYSRYEDFNRLEAAKKQVEHTLTDLRQAQQQLIQSEKMASLGELTAGIAHEIQNPLNFVNNFSDVSAELLGEMSAEMRKGHNTEALAIAEDVMENLGKILHHGKRADAIVKGMLQHSRTSTGQTEPTDLNVLADEYLRLAYHGLRAKDKTFNANFKTDFDQGLGKVDLIPQDIGRVLVNLINNAFFAVNEKKKENIPGYEPTVTVSTKKLNGSVVLTVSDNGIGIPQKVQDKIFQPFFTTKPTGQGTGLGLSLSYDIVNAHGGELTVESKEGGGSSFMISLPAENK